jgi:hypothetical protein
MHKEKFFKIWQDKVGVLLSSRRILCILLITQPKMYVQKTLRTITQHL